MNHLRRGPSGSTVSVSQSGRCLALSSWPILRVVVRKCLVLRQAAPDEGSFYAGAESRHLPCEGGEQPQQPEYLLALKNNNCSVYVLKFDPSDLLFAGQELELLHPEDCCVARVPRLRPRGRLRLAAARHGRADQMGKTSVRSQNFLSTTFRIFVRQRSALLFCLSNDSMEARGGRLARPLLPPVILYTSPSSRSESLQPRHSSRC